MPRKVKIIYQNTCNQNNCEDYLPATINAIDYVINPRNEHYNQELVYNKNIIKQFINNKRSITKATGIKAIKVNCYWCLGYCALRGIGERIDCHKAQDYLEKSIELGKTMENSENIKYALYNLAIMYAEGLAEGLIGQVNWKKAKSLLHECSQFNYAPALCELGKCYIEGLGGKKNTTLGLKLLHDADNCEAYWYLGQIYDKTFTNIEFDADYTKALEYHMKAVEKGKYESNLNIAKIYIKLAKTDEERRQEFIDNANHYYDLIANTIDNEDFRISSLISKAVDFHANFLNEHNTAIDITKSLYEEYIQNKDKFNCDKIIIMGTLANLFDHIHAYNECIFYHQQIINYLNINLDKIKANESPRFYVEYLNIYNRSLIKLGRSFYLIGNYEKSIEYYNCLDFDEYAFIKKHLKQCDYNNMFIGILLVANQQISLYKNLIVDFVTPHLYHTYMLKKQMQLEFIEKSGTQEYWEQMQLSLEVD